VVASAGAAVKICSVRLPCLLPFLIAAFAMLAGCSSTGNSIAELAPEINGTLDREKLMVAVGDTISVVFPFKKEWNLESRVRPDGSASFFLIDDVQVAGLSLLDLDTRLTNLYREKWNGQEALELTVDVPNRGGVGEVSSNAGGVVFVVGEVEHPGLVGISGRALTLTEAIGAAGGHKKATANLRNTILVRKLAGTGEMRSWRLDADIYSWGSLPPIFLQDRDLIFVPNTAIDGLDIWVDKYIRQMLPFPYLSAPL
jgi:protein involved in polysaccharide export with SLBB domain